MIDKGDLGGVAIDGLAVAVYADWPGAIHEGGGRAVAYVDERADESQMIALRQLVRGELGGPWGIFINTYELDGPRIAPFHIEMADYDTKIRIGDAVELELDTIRNPVSGAEVHPEIVLPEGLVTRHAKAARSKHFHVAAPLGYDHSGQYAAIGTFHYTS